MTEDEVREMKKKFTEKFNTADKFLVYKFLPHETYANAVFDVWEFIEEAIVSKWKEEPQCYINGGKYPQEVDALGQSKGKVKLPEKIDTHNVPMYIGKTPPLTLNAEYQFAKGFNACLEEVRRLNKGDS